MSLPAGPFLVGNVCDADYPPSFAEIVVPKPEREKQWERVKAANAQNRLCDLFKNRASFERYRKKRKVSALHHGYSH
jgi:hypothetical protein